MQKMIVHDPQARAVWQRPTRAAAAWRALKVAVHVALRWARNLLNGPGRVAPSTGLAHLPIVAEHASLLWSDGREDEFLLRCGKVQNLRVAARCLDGLELAPGQVLSFWSQLGRPSTGRGFAIGREIVSGCVVPSVGGGLCQLSNALASVAVAAGIRLVEHHRHSARFEGQAPTTGEEATVAWNYIDLRLVAEFAFRIEALLTADRLVVRIRAAQPRGQQAPAGRRPTAQTWRLAEAPVARGCLSCDETACFRHRRAARPAAARMALLLNEPSAELAHWLQEVGRGADWMLPWVSPGRRTKAWKPPPGIRPWVATAAGWRRIVRQRRVRGEGAARQGLRLAAGADLARCYARALRPEHTELVVSQDLLVPLWRLGALGGRVFDVFVPELPAAEVQKRLDLAAQARPEVSSLRDFRADVCWLQDEWAALAAARSCLTPHAEVQRVLAAAGMAVRRLPWVVPPVVSRPLRAPGAPLTITLAASALARKGADEVAAVARKLGARVLVLGTPPADASAWAGVHWQSIGFTGPWLDESDLVLLPAHVEHQPRALLQALAVGLPVVASPACGLDSRVGLIEVLPGDADLLERAVIQALGHRDSV